MGQYIDRNNHLVRWGLIAANILSMTFCLVAVCVGVWTLVSKSFLSGLLTDRLFLSCAYLQVVAGLLCFCNCIYGCYSAYKEVKSLLVVYTAVSVLLLTVLIIGGVLAYIFRHQVQENLKAQLVNDLRKYDPREESNMVTWSWDKTQVELQCCGMMTVQVGQAWQVWKYNTAVNPGPGLEKIIVPGSCCKTDMDCVINNQTVVENIWEGDCYHKGMEFLQSHSQVMGGVTLAVAVIMVFGILLSVVLFKKTR